MKKLLLLLFLSLTFINPVEGAEKRSFPEGKQAVFLGLDTKSSPTQLQDGRAQDLQNVRFTTTRGLIKRNGYSLINNIIDIPDTDFKAVTGIYYNKFSDGTEEIFVTQDVNLWYDNSGTWSWIEWASISSNKNYQFVWITALDSVIFTNDVNVVKKVNSTPTVSNLDLSDLATDAPTKVKCLAWFQNFLILGNTYENKIEKPTRIRWSNIGTIETWTEADRNDISELGGQEINALIELYNDLYIFLTNSVWKMSHVGGDEQFKFTKVLDNIGCIAKNSVQNVILQNSQRGIMFLTRDAEVYFFNGITATNISEIISPTMEALNYSRLQYAVSENTGSEYRLYASTGTKTQNDTCLLFNYEIGEWSKFAGMYINAVTGVRSSDIRYSYAGNYQGCVFKLDNTALDSDVYGTTGTVDAVDIYTTSTASGLQILYDASSVFNTATGALVTITGGTGSSQSTLSKVIVGCTATGIMVESAYSTTPDSTTTYSIGAIDAYYQTKDYDLGDSSRIKSLVNLFFWAKEQGSVSVDLSYKVDFAGTVETVSVSQDGAGGLWGSAIWGTSLWGGTDALLERVNLKKECRYMNFKVSEDDIDERFDLYGWNIIYTLKDIL